MQATAPPSPILTLGETSAPGRYDRHGVIYQQGEYADSVFHLDSGLVKLSTLTQCGKEAVVAIVQKGEYFGEGCLAGSRERTATATALSESRVSRYSRHAISQRLRTDPVFAGAFTHHLIQRNLRYEQDLTDHLSNSSEKRLARVLLMLSRAIERPAKIDQQTLAKMVGTTRSRVCHFMNKFRRLGFIDYSDGLEVRPSLERVLDAD